VTYDEIMAQANNSGMTQEEWERREALIRAVSQHNPELAAEIARGPYRMNGGSGPSAPPQSTSDVVRGPYGEGAQVPSRGSSNPMNSAPIASPSINSTGVSSGGALPPVVQGPVNKWGNMGSGPPEPTGNPRYDFPDYQRRESPSVTINITPQTYAGTPPGNSAPFGSVPFDPTISAQGYGGAATPGTQFPPSGPLQGPPMGLGMPSFGGPPAPSGNSNERAVFPGGAMSAMSNQNYPYASNYISPPRPIYTPPSPYMAGNLSR
jgi:hypothetical protein